MKIVYIHQYFENPAKNGSGGSRTYEMVRRLAKAGHDVHIVTSDTSQTENSRNGWRTEFTDNFTVHSFPVPYSNLMDFQTRMKAFVSFAFSSSVRARQLNGDVVFATSTPLTVCIPGIFATAFRKSPFVFEVRDLWPDVPIAMGALPNPVVRQIAKTMEKIAYSKAQHIVALSPDMASEIMKKGVSKEKVTVIPNASDNDLFDGHAEAGVQWRQAHDWLQDRSMVLYCGTLGKVNNVQYLVDVAYHTHRIDPEVRFVVVGRGNDEDNVRDLAIRRGVLNENFFMLPQVAKAAVPAIFAAANVTTSTVAPIPELFANSANKFFDSFAAGRPVLINHGGWQAAVLEESGAGWVMDMNSPSSASQSLVEYLHDKNALMMASVAAKKLALDRFSRDRLARKLLLVLEKANSTIMR